LLVNNSDAMISVPACATSGSGLRIVDVEPLAYVWWLPITSLLLAVVQCHAIPSLVLNRRLKLAANTKFVAFLRIRFS
jgi:hypothetical protein